MDDGDYDYWEPPSESEMKLMQARRERSDKISKLMGDYLLKGYKMLGITCPACDTILLQTKQGTNYCITCSELDSDADKDDPVTNQAAALALARERKVTNPPPRATPLQHSGQPNPAQNCSQSQSQSQGKPDDHVEVSSTDTSPRNRHLVQPHGVSASVNSTGLFPHPNISGSGAAVGKHSQTGGGDSQKHISVLLEKIDWAVTELRGTQSVEYSIQLCQLIKICAETVSSVKTALEA